MNNAIFFFFYNLAHQSTFVDNLIIFFAVYFPFVTVIFAGLFLLFHHEVFRAESPYQVFMEKKKEMFFVFFSSFLAYFLSAGLKLIFQTKRPFAILEEVTPLFSQTGFAFPSGHAAFFSALAFAIFFVHKKAGYVFMFFALLIGLARIAAGVHFPIDILGGFALGAGIAYLVKKI